jgi:twitching motility protein PilT
MEPNKNSNNQSGMDFTYPNLSGDAGSQDDTANANNGQNGSAANSNPATASSTDSSASSNNDQALGTQTGSPNRLQSTPPAHAAQPVDNTVSNSEQNNKMSSPPSSNTNLPPSTPKSAGESGSGSPSNKETKTETEESKSKGGSPLKALASKLSGLKDEFIEDSGKGANDNNYKDKNEKSDTKQQDMGKSPMQSQLASQPKQNSQKSQTPSQDSSSVAVNPPPGKFGNKNATTPLSSQSVQSTPVESGTDQSIKDSGSALQGVNPPDSNTMGSANLGGPTQNVVSPSAQDSSKASEEGLPQVKNTETKDENVQNPVNTNQQVVNKGQSPQPSNSSENSGTQDAQGSTGATDVSVLMGTPASSQTQQGNQTVVDSSQQKKEDSSDKQKASAVSSSGHESNNSPNTESASNNATNSTGPAVGLAGNVSTGSMAANVTEDGFNSTQSSEQSQISSQPKQPSNIEPKKEVDQNENSSQGETPETDTVSKTEEGAPAVTAGSYPYSIHQLLDLVVERDASDLHISKGYPVMLRVDGSLVNVNQAVVQEEHTQDLILPVLPEQKKELLEVNREVDLAYAHKEDARFRINAYYQQQSLAAAFRLIPNKIRTIDELKLPQVYHQLANLRQGLVLVTGPTGSGKSTTLAAVINEINQTRPDHIITIEDPIEYVFPKGKAMVDQRELHEDTHSWEIALKSALRQDPDVILVGEMRDYDTISSAITLAETGHLVFATLHTNSASQTIDRIIDVFPEHQQSQVRSQLSNVIEAVVAQRLLPLDKGGRTAVSEIMIATPAIRNLIREAKTHQIDNVIRTSADIGMISLEHSLVKLVREGGINMEKAQEYAVHPEEVVRLMKG